jgi:hypothetical protein
MVFGYPLPQILEKQQGGIPVYSDKSRAHIVIVYRFVFFLTIPCWEKRTKLLAG